jgi:hypothetical protein
MIRFCLSAAFVLFASVSFGETVSVRSGEHSTFSRLVFRFSTRPDWEMGRVNGGFELRSGRPDVEFDLERTFELIPRDRVSSVTDLGEGRLFIVSDCDCHVEVFDLEGGYLVVDVKDGPAPQDSQAQNMIFSEPEEVGAVPEISSDLVLPIIEMPSVAATTAKLPAIFGLPAAQSSHQEAPAITLSPVPEEPDVAKSGESVSDLEKTLLEQISRAATQGLLKADLPDIQETVEEVKVSRSPIPDDLPMEIPEPIVEPQTHFAVSTAIDRARIGSGPVVSATTSGQACTSPEFFRVEDWGVPLEEGSDIGAFRAGLITEYDTTDAQGATALVRHYVYTSFGAEARALLRYYRDLVDRPDILETMAQIMDQGYADRATDYVAQMACDGPVALWAVLSQPQIFGYQTINTEAVFQ